MLRTYYQMVGNEWMNEWMKVYFLLSQRTFKNEKWMCYAFKWIQLQNVYWL